MNSGKRSFRYRILQIIADTGFVWIGRSNASAIHAEAFRLVDDGAIEISTMDEDGTTYEFAGLVEDLPEDVQVEIAQINLDRGGLP